MSGLNESGVFNNNYYLSTKSINYGIIFYDINGIITNLNKNFSVMIGYPENEIIGNHITSFLDQNGQQAFQMNLQKLNDKIPKHELAFIKKDGQKIHTNISIFFDDLLKSNIGIVINKTGLEHIENAIKIKEDELKLKTAKLKKIYIALKELFEDDIEEKAADETNALNIVEMLSPYLIKFKDMDSIGNELDYLNLFGSDIKKLSPSPSNKILLEQSNLSHAEIKVAKLIKEGKSSKDIANSLCISERTVDTHRFRIRKKLGICKQEKNLRAYLLSLQ
jgi:PAS domain S-box-containing protein